MVAREFHVPRGLTLDITSLFLFLRSCILCAFFANRVHSFGFLFAVVFSPCAILTILPHSLSPLFTDVDLSFIISSTSIEFGGISSLNMFCSRPPFFCMCNMLGTVANSRR